MIRDTMSSRSLADEKETRMKIENLKRMYHEEQRKIEHAKEVLLVRERLRRFDRESTKGSPRRQRVVSRLVTNDRYASRRPSSPSERSEIKRLRDEMDRRKSSMLIIESQIEAFRKRLHELESHEEGPAWGDAARIPERTPLSEDDTTAMSSMLDAMRRRIFVGEYSNVSSMTRHPSYSPPSLPPSRDVVSSSIPRNAVRERENTTRKTENESLPTTFSNDSSQRTTRIDRSSYHHHHHVIRADVVDDADLATPVRDANLPSRRSYEARAASSEREMKTTPFQPSISKRVDENLSATRDLSSTFNCPDEAPSAETTDRSRGKSYEDKIEALRGELEANKKIASQLCNDLKSEFAEAKRNERLKKLRPLSLESTWMSTPVSRTMGDVKIDFKSNIKRDEKKRTSTMPNRSTKSGNLSLHQHTLLNMFKSTYGTKKIGVTVEPTTDAKTVLHADNFHRKLLGIHETETEPFSGIRSPQSRLWDVNPKEYAKMKGMSSSATRTIALLEREGPPDHEGDECL